MICKTCAWCADLGLKAISHTQTEEPEINANWLGPMMFAERNRVAGGPCPGGTWCDCAHKDVKNATG